MKEIKITTEYIKLDQFLKFSGIVLNGTEAKQFIKNGNVIVNDEVETRRGKKLINGDIVKFMGNKYKIISD